jgi:hypothetical protein
MNDKYGRLPMPWQGQKKETKPLRFARLWLIHPWIGFL